MELIFTKLLTQNIIIYLNVLKAYEKYVNNNNFFIVGSSNIANDCIYYGDIYII